MNDGAGERLGDSALDVRKPLPDWVGKAARFGVVGGLAAALDYGVLALLVHLGASPYVARIASLAVTVVFTWALNRSVTFRTAAPPSWREFGHYVLVALGGMALNYGIYSGLLLLGAPLWAAFVVGTGVTAVYSFWRYSRVFAAR